MKDLLSVDILPEDEEYDVGSESGTEPPRGQVKEERLLLILRAPPPTVRGQAGGQQEVAQGESSQQEHLSNSKLSEGACSDCQALTTTAVLRGR